MLLLHRRTSAQTQSSQHWTCEEEKMSILTWKTSANHANISTSNREVYCRALPTNNHKRQKQNWSNTIHIKNANKKTKMITPPSTDKDKTKVISPQITSKGNCKEKHDLTTNHRQRLPGWRLFRLGKGTTLDRVQSLYPERNYFLWFLGFASQPSAILWGWEVTVFYNVHHTMMYWKEIWQSRPGDRHDKLGTAGLDRHSNLQQLGQSRKSQSPAQQRWNMKIWDWKFRAYINCVVSNLNSTQNRIVLSRFARNRGPEPIKSSTMAARVCLAGLSYLQIFERRGSQMLRDVENRVLLLQLGDSHSNRDTLDHQAWVENLENQTQVRIRSILINWQNVCIKCWWETTERQTT